MPSSTYPECYKVFDIPGLSTAAAVDHSIKTPGYIAFVRKRKNSSAGEDEDIQDDNNVINMNSDESDTLNS
eukprot:4436889-Ditylum_brightwellii.AAC.1